MVRYWLALKVEGSMAMAWLGFEGFGEMTRLKLPTTAPVVACVMYSNTDPVSTTRTAQRTDHSTAYILVHPQHNSKKAHNSKKHFSETQSVAATVVN